MSLENEVSQTLDQLAEMNTEWKRKSKITYTKEYLLSLSELDVCKTLPSGFDQSLLSEFEDASQDRQRISGSLSLHSFRRNDYSSSPPTRGELGNYSRGTHGKWESRSTGRSDRDSDSQSDWDSDSGKRHTNQSRRSWQAPEHDGLLGSGSFPRPSGYAAGASAPRFRANDHQQINKNSEPYHPPRPYKAVPHLRRETNDSYNDETFGSSECTSEDRAEEERKRRASFELMRREQHKAFQEKQNSNPEKRKDGFDITLLLGDSKDDDGFLGTSSEFDEPVVLAVPKTETDKRTLPMQTYASRPLVPPGFTSTILEKNLGPKTSMQPGLLEVGKPEHEGNLMRGKGNCDLDVDYDNQEGKQVKEKIILTKQHQELLSVHVSDDSKGNNILDLLQDFDVSNDVVRMENHLYKSSDLSEAVETSENRDVIGLDTKMSGNETLGESNQSHSTSILSRLFGNSLTINSGGASGSIEHHDNKANEAWNPETVQSSKFAHWFEEERKPVQELSSGRPNDLLFLIVGGEKGELQDSDVKFTKNVSDSPAQSSESVDKHATSDVISVTVKNPDNINFSKAVTLPAVLTCEDLEQSILSEISEKDPVLVPPVQGWSSTDAKAERGKTEINNHASQHLLSLLQKGAGQRDMLPSHGLEVRSSDELHNAEPANVGALLHSSSEPNANTDPISGKSLTLETLFGSAFMKELQSVGAPVSAQRGSVGSARVDASVSRAVLPVMDDRLLSSAAEIGPNRISHKNTVSGSHQGEQLNSDRIKEHLLGFDDPRTELNSSNLQTGLGSKFGGFDESAEVRLPEEDSLIAVSDPEAHQSFMPIRGIAKSELLPSQDTPVGIAEKLAALSSVFRDERAIIGGQKGPPFLHGHFDVKDNDLPFHHVQPSPPQLHPHQHRTGPLLHPLDSHPVNMNYQMKLMAPEGIIHHDSPANHQFPANMLRPPFHHHGAGPTVFDSPSHSPMLQPLQMPGNFPSPHPLQGFRGGIQLPPHSNTQATGLMQEVNPVQGFPFGQLQHNFAGRGLPPSAPDGGSGSNHPEAFRRLIEMELRSNSKQVRSFAAGGRGQGMYGHELDMGFGFR